MRKNGHSLCINIIYSKEYDDLFMTIYLSAYCRQAIQNAYEKAKRQLDMVTNMKLLARQAHRLEHPIPFLFLGTSDFQYVPQSCIHVTGGMVQQIRR